MLRVERTSERSEGDEGSLVKRVMWDWNEGVEWVAERVCIKSLRSASQSYNCQSLRGQGTDSVT